MDNLTPNFDANITEALQRLNEMVAVEAGNVEAHKKQEQFFRDQLELLEAELKEIDHELIRANNREALLRSHTSVYDAKIVTINEKKATWSKYLLNFREEPHGDFEKQIVEFENNSAKHREQMDIVYSKHIERISAKTEAIEAKAIELGTLSQCTTTDSQTWKELMEELQEVKAYQDQAATQIDRLTTELNNLTFDLELLGQ